ncbi:MAG TPA: T9SS type A sorting domain-containing protein, partial [Bacteroidales bacterium]|nr:T9SS type A sorting domain-containing protein [Bacteroidales bacterium]
LADSITGIYSYNSGFGVNSLCNSNVIPCDDTTHGEFSGLKYGIKAISSGVLKYIQIDDCLFSDNLRSVYLSGITAPRVNRNLITTKVSTSQANTSCGIYLNNCTGYSVQENKISGHYPSGISGNSYETGIVINNSGEASNEIYNNTFTRLQNGITAQDDNRGLVCKCNDYDSVKFDQSALVSGTPGSLGIAPMQGASDSVTSPAGNTFSPQHTTQQLPESDLKNQGAAFQYFHHRQAQSGVPPRVEPVYFSSSISRQNTGWDYDKFTACPSRLNGGGVENPIESSVEKLVQAQALIDSLETGLDELVDGGNTEETAANIVFSNPEEALDIYNDLLTKSPYLSDTVMTEAATKEEVISNTLLHDILVANPQSATSDEVLDQLDQRIDPMPEDMYNEILQGENILAPLTAEKASIAALKTDNTTLYYHLMNRYLADTSQYATDSLLYLLDVQNTSEAAYLEAFIQLNNGEFTAMNSALSGISSEFDLSNEEQLLHSYYQQFFALLQKMQTDTLPDLQADSLTTEQLVELVENSPEPVKSYSRNILVANHAIEYLEPYLYDDGLKSSSIRKKHRMGASTKQGSLLVFPNPAKDYIIVRYNLANELSDAQEKAVLEIVKTTGQVIQSLTLQAVTGQVMVSTKTFVPGVYLIHIKGVSKKVEAIKFNVIH